VRSTPYPANETRLGHAQAEDRLGQVIVGGTGVASPLQGQELVNISSNEDPTDLDDSLNRQVESAFQSDDPDPDPDSSDPLKYICRGYDPNAPHFDGLEGASSKDFLIDLDTNSMER
jgi:hypothetical protein